MNIDRFKAITQRYANLRIAVVGDFCLDRYLEIDPSQAELSLETGLPVYNVVNVRAQPGAAGTILNNLVALGVGEIYPVGFRGEDGEGFELDRALKALAGVKMDHFLTTSSRRTFTYCKPLIVEPNQNPRELNRLDSKNWTPTPDHVSEHLIKSLADLKSQVDAVIVMDQVDHPNTGVVTPQLLKELASFPKSTLVIADSRRGLRDYPPLAFKMNAKELGLLLNEPQITNIEQAATELANRNQHPVFITLAEQGIVGAMPNQTAKQVPALPLRGPIDIVGAGDSVMANLATALAAKADLGEALELAAIASSIVIHKLGTTGTASVEEIAECWRNSLQGENQ